MHTRLKAANEEHNALLVAQTLTTLLTCHQDTKLLEHVSRAGPQQGCACAVLPWATIVFAPSTMLLKTMIDKPMDAQFVKVKIRPGREKGNQHWQYDISQAIHNEGEVTTRASCRW